MKEIKIFKDAYFGKAYRTRDGRKAILGYYHIGGDIIDQVVLITTGANQILVDGNGKDLNEPYHNTPYDIVSEWIEPIVTKCEWRDYFDYRIMMPNGEGHVRVSFFQEEIIISDLFVAEEHRHKGYASILLDKVDELLNGLVAIIFPLEEWQKEWYEKRGYVIGKEESVDKEKENLKDELDALNMRYLSQVALWESKYKESVDKACATMCRFCPHQCKDYPHDDCQVLLEFRKKMEDKQ